MSRVKLNLIAAACENMGIGVNGNLPWRLKMPPYRARASSRSRSRSPIRLASPRQLDSNEMAYFSSMTTKVKEPSKTNAVIMGRVTWDCIPDKYRPLTDRVNIVLTHHVEKLKENVPDGVIVVKSLDDAIDYIEGRQDIESTWVIGGSSIYKAAMEHVNCGKIYLTEIQKNFVCDTFFPPIDKRFQLVTEDGVSQELQVEGDISYYFRIYQKV